MLVAETAAPPPEPGFEDHSIKGFFFRLFQSKAGSAVPSANRITLLRDADGDGVAEIQHALSHRPASPFGMALVGTTLYVADADALLAFPYDPGRDQHHRRAAHDHARCRPAATITGPRASPPAPTARLYVGVGSNSNIAEHGMAEEEERAAIWEIDPATGSHRLYATGLRNPVGLDLPARHRTTSTSSSTSATNWAATSFPII